MLLEFPLALLLLPVAFAVAVIMQRSFRDATGTAAALQGSAPRQSWYAARIVFVVVFLAAMTVVAARPYVAYSQTGSYLLVVDVSRSMQARFACSEPTFLDRARRVMRQTIESVPEAEFGIVAFDRFAFPVTHMTSDQAYLGDVVENGLYVGLMLDATQTQIANALTVVADKMERLPDALGDVTHVVVLSDGHVTGAFERRLQSPLQRLKDRGVRVSAVGIGNPEPTPIADNRNGQCINEAIEVNGERVLIPLRSDILKVIATEGAGSYYTEREAGALSSALRDGLTPALAGTDSASTPRRDVSGVFVAIATFALLGFVYLPVRFPDSGKLRE